MSVSLTQLGQRIVERRPTFAQPLQYNYKKFDCVRHVVNV